MKIAVCTMMYNEPEFFPIWWKYYSGQVGAANCFVIDHGSDICHQSVLEIRNIINIPRSPQDEVQRVEAISNFSAYLLNYYDVVIYTDIDEILVPNPDLYSGIREFCERTSGDVISAVGLNIQHLIDDEVAFDPGRPVIEQRDHVRFVAAMCKPLLIRTPVRWSRGFHSCNQKVQFGEIYLLHLRNFDLNVSLARMARTRVIPRRTQADADGAAHQRVDDEQLIGWLKAAAGLPKVKLESISIENDPVKALLSQILIENENRIRIDLNAQQLWKLPSSFLGVF